MGVRFGGSPEGGLIWGGGRNVVVIAWSDLRVDLRQHLLLDSSNLTWLELEEGGLILGEVSGAAVF